LILQRVLLWPNWADHLRAICPLIVGSNMMTSSWWRRHIPCA